MEVFTIMTERNENRRIALIQAGGISTRNVLSIPNQFVMVDDKPVIVYVLEAYEKHPAINEIDVVCLSGWEKTVSSYAERYHITKLNKIITGGATIIQSTVRGLKDISSDLDNDDVVILQEATRPLISEGLISKIISSYNKYGDSVLIRPMSEYVQVERTNDSYSLCNRDSLFSLESPEIYNANRLLSFIDRLENGVDDDGSCCALLINKLGIKIHYCENTANNPKIIRQEDLYYFKALRQVLL